MVKKKQRRQSKADSPIVARARLPAATPPQRLLDRELSQLAFADRVLAQAVREDVPLAERLRYVCIVSSILDEFFEVRMSDLIDEMIESGGWGPAAPQWESFVRVSDRAHALVDKQYRLFNEVLTPALARRRIAIVSHGQRSSRQRKWVREYFEREVRPLLSPIGLDPSHPFPLLMNKALNFVVQVEGKDAFGRPSSIVVLKVPRVLPRVIPLPAKLAPRTQAFVMLSSVIRAHLADVFAGRNVAGF